MAPCPSCGHPNEESAAFCEECAAPLARPAAPQAPEEVAAPDEGAAPAPGPAPTVTHPLIRCPSCGHPNEDTADFCENCATRLVVPAEVTAPRPKSSTNLRLAWATVGLAVLLLLLGGAAWWLTRDDGTEQVRTAATTTTAATVPPTTAAAPSTPATTPSTALPDPADLPSGLFCRDLHARGYSYAQAVDYWNLEGQPDRMVAQELPCQTVYPLDIVYAYWGLDSAGTPPGD